MPHRERRFTFDDLPESDLVVDAIYAGRGSGLVTDDPVPRLLPVGNQGGIRYAGSTRSGSVRLVVLYTTGVQLDWPDSLDPRSGLFTYYGDNRHPGRDLHNTARSGNRVLREAFNAAHSTPADRSRVPPFLLFEKLPGAGRDVEFRGLLAPGAAGLPADEDLVAVWRTTNGQRFQNYRAIFTVLDVNSVPRAWIQQVLDGNPLGHSCPQAWRRWARGRRYTALAAPATTVIRSRNQQLPTDPVGDKILETVRSFFRGREHAFEACAVEIWRLVAPATGRCDVTRPSRDGGRDAIGEYLIGPPADRVAVEFALEAKCYNPERGVGVRDVSRLISRLRHRQFGVFVTTSYFHKQVYEEIRSDGHPIALVSGSDLVSALRARGYGQVPLVQSWLSTFA